MFIVTCDLRLYPKEFYENGLPIISSSVMRNHPAALSPRIKSLNYLNNVLAKIEAIDAGDLQITPDDGIAARISEAIRDVTKLRGDVTIVAAGTLPNDGKVIEDARSYK